MAFLSLLSTPSRNRGFLCQVNKSEKFPSNLVLCELHILIKLQKVFYVQIKYRSDLMTLSLCVAAVSQTNSQCPLVVSEALHAWKEERVTIISPKEIVYRQLLYENCINVYSGIFLKQLFNPGGVLHQHSFL